MKQQVLANPSDLAQAAADSALSDLGQAIAQHGNATWVIAGGTAPMAAYRLLASSKDAIDWSKVTVVMGDERCVPHDSPDSNWGQADSLLLHLLPLSALSVRPATDTTAEQAADRYERHIKQLPLNGQGLPRLDLVWLGMGEDGHTMSLFPDHPSSQQRSDRLVIAVHDSPKPPPDRITLTFKALEGAVVCLIVIAGAGKADAFKHIAEGDATLPIARAAAVVEAAGGQVTWLLDAAAAGQAA